MKPTFKFAAFLATIGCSILSASATTFHWDGLANVTLGSSDNSNTASQAWLSGGLWDNGASSAALASWTAGDAAVFGGSAVSQTVTLGSTITVGNLTFGSGGDGSGTSGTAYTISGGTLTLSGTTLTANTATVITSGISNAGSATISGSGALTLRGNISGTGTLTHSGSALLTLSAVDGGRDYFGALSGAGSIRVGTSGTFFYGIHGSLSGLTGTFSTAGLFYNRASALGSTAAAFVQESGGVWLFSNDDISNLNVTYHMGSLSGSGTLAGTGYNPARTGTKTLSIGALNTDTTYSGSIVNSFAGGGGTVTLTKVGGGTLTLAGGNSYTGGTTINGGILQVGTGTGTAGVLPGNATVNASGTLKFNYGGFGVVYGGQLSGTGPVIVTGTNDLQLSGNNSAYTGILTVDGSAAQLRMRNDNAVSGAALVLANGGAASVFSYVSDHNLTVGSLASGDSTTWVRVGSGNNRGLIVGSNNQSTTFAGVIKNDAGGTGFLTKTGSGTLTLSGTNTYTGATTINQGTLSLGTTGSIANSSIITTASGAFFDVSGLTGGFTLVGGQTLKGEGTVTGSVSEDASGIGDITAGNGASGTLTITGDLALNGLADVNIGTLSNYTSTAAVVVSGDLNVTAGPGDVFINLPTDPVSPGTYRLISHANTLADIDAFVVNPGSAPLLSSRQVGNLVNNAGSIDYVVSGANPVWTGALDSAWTTATLANPKNWTLPGGGVTDYIEYDVVTFNDTATGSTVVDLSMNVNPTSVSFNHSTKNYTLQSTGNFAIAAGSLNKSGTGILTITNANAFSGDATLSTGIIRVGNDSALGAGNLVLNGGTLSSDSATARTLGNPAAAIGGDVTLGDATLNGALTLTGSVDLGAATRALTTASDVTLAGSISNGSFSKSGSGTLTLTGANSHAATTINAGTLKIGDGGATGTAGTGTITNNSALVVDRSGAPSIGGAINGTGSLTVNGGGTLSLSAQNAYTGTTTVNGSVLNLTMGISYTPSKVGSTVVINSGGSLVLNAYFQTGFAYNLAGNVAPANITVNAGGTFNKNGQATYIQNLTLDGTGAVIGAGGGGSDNLQLCGDVTATSTAAGAPTISSLNLVAGAYTNAGNTRTIHVTHGAGSTSTDDLTVGVIGQQSSGPAANLIKSGGGTLKLTGANTFAGTTTVSQGTLKGATNFTGPLVVQSGATLAPGDGIGTLAANATTIDGTYLCELDATTSDVLAVTGSLDIDGATLTVSGTPVAASYTIATYTGSRTGTFTASVSGYSLDYSTAGQIKLVKDSGFATWITGFGLAAADQDPTDDPDHDGVDNLVEYAIAGRNPAVSEGAIGSFDGATRTLSFAKRTEAAADSAIAYQIQESDDLGILDIWTEAPAGPDYVNNSTTISYKLPIGKAKTFARLVVIRTP